MVEKKPKKVALHVRLDPDLHAAVKAYAQATGRSVNNAVVYLLRAGVHAEWRRPQ